MGYQERVGRIQALLNEFRQAPVVVTCRALDYVETLDLHKLEIQPLAPLRQRAFVANYLGPEQGEALFWQMAGQDVADAWQVWQEAGGTLEAFWTAKTMPEGFEWRTPSASGNVCGTGSCRRCWRWGAIPTCCS